MIITRKTRQIIALLTAILLLSSCDPCANSDCQGQSTCIYGDCVCLDFYEGSTCQEAYSDKFVGTWSGDWECGSALNNSSFRIIKQSENRLLMGEIPLTMITSTRFRVEPHKGIIEIIEGRGELEEGFLTINLTYQASPGQRLSCRYKLSK